MPELNSELQAQADQAATLQRELEGRLAQVKQTQAEIDLIWSNIENAMIIHEIKSIKGDFGSLTIAERIDWDTTEDLPTKFYKKVVDKKKITDTFRLEGKAPKGASPKYTKYLTKRLK